jgi:hypothetical protein
MRQRGHSASASVVPMKGTNIIWDQHWLIALYSLEDKVARYGAASHRSSRSLKMAEFRLRDADAHTHTHMHTHAHTHTYLQP